MRYMTILLVGLLSATSLARAQSLTMTVHEWGTFTNLQDEAGKSVGGINSDDEPLPPFTHNLRGDWNVGDAAAQRYNSPFIKGFPRAHSEVTIRLETPVLYFHPSTPVWTTPLNVHVEFHGGYLTQFYPNASAGKIENQISAKTLSHLDWKNLSIGGDHPGPQTDSHVWLAPRKVNAADITTAKNESERYLFYRGVGHIDAPLRLVRTDQTIQVHAQLDPAFGPSAQLDIRHLWFCEFRDDGSCAFRTIPPLSIGPETQPVLAETDADFEASQFSRDRLTELKSQMRQALTSQGLFEDEAEALLSTWELSYFKSTGVRLFYIVPREWTEHYLPLQIAATFGMSCSLAAPRFDVKRVMVGRIDLVTPGQRDVLRAMGSTPDAHQSDAVLWRQYEQLGRFRNALLLDEVKRRPSPVLEAFMQAHMLDAWH